MAIHRNVSASYDRVAWCYDTLAHCYSIGQIRRAKNWHSAYLKKGDRTLYAGVGTGEEICQVIREGIHVVAVDISQRMIALTRRRLSREGLYAELHCGDVLNHTASPLYDVVVAHFFLNMFTMAEVPEVLRRLASFLRPRGHLYVADFAPAGRGLASYFRYAHFVPVLTVGRVLGLCRLHSLHDYGADFDSAGLLLDECRSLSVGFGPHVYSVWRCVRR